MKNLWTSQIESHESGYCFTEQLSYLIAHSLNTKFPYVQNKAKSKGLVSTS